MKIFRLILIALATGLGTGSAAIPAGWMTNLTAALETAKQSQRPVLVYFTASWCGPCKLMARTTLTNEAVLNVLTNLPHVALDIDEFPDLAKEHGIQAVPTFEMLLPNGSEASRETGYRDAGQFVQWLTNSTAEVSAAVAKQKQIEERLAVIAELLKTNDIESTKASVSELFDLCAERDTATRKTVTALLNKLAERDAALLLDGLSHTRLATRIEVANLLRAKIGTFDIDPWSDNQARAKGISNWRSKLAAKPASAGTP